MRSYYEHLKTTTPATEKLPALRSSAIFPAFQGAEISTRILFLNYWQLKRSIPELTCKVFVRDEKGNLLKQTEFPVQEVRAYQISLEDFIKGPFTGTMEIEFHAAQDLVFTFPATVINYYGPSFCTFVHTAQRTYNNEQDAQANSVSHVPESGFNIYSNKNCTSFIAMINGDKTAPPQLVKSSFYNDRGEKIEKEIPLEPFQPFEMRIIHPSELMELNSFLGEKAGTCKLDFRLSGVFPRLIAGNQLKKPFASVITHTYYDCSVEEDSSNFWKPQDPNWQEASLMLPFIGGDHEAFLDFYPIFSPSPFTLDLEVYDKEGSLLKAEEGIISFKEGYDKFQRLSLNDFYPSEECLGARLIARPLSEKSIPARIKIAIDIGFKNRGLPCNICTNLQPYVPAFTNKKSSFKWAPLLGDQPHAWAIIMHSSPAKNLKENAEIKISFYRQQDTTHLERHITLPAQGHYKIDLLEDKELAEFFKGKPGWFTAVTTNPYTTTYYFAENPSGVVGGDHGF
jgi:hypothetical protein